jgi:protein-S-isoprenylcysteine O-methyltransferase Ste14
LKWLLPPVFVALAFVAMFLLRALWPEPRLLPPPWQLAGIAVVVGGLAVGGIAAGLFRRRGTNINTFRDPTRLVTDGPFAWSRNPMYLGFLLLLVGAAMLANAWVALLPALAFFLAAQFWYIPFEERAAAARFGDDYAAYRRRVRRWL